MYSLRLLIYQRCFSYCIRLSPNIHDNHDRGSYLPAFAKKALPIAMEESVNANSKVDVFHKYSQILGRLDYRSNKLINSTLKDEFISTL